MSFVILFMEISVKTDTGLHFDTSSVFNVGQICDQHILLFLFWGWKDGFAEGSLSVLRNLNKKIKST